MKQEHWQDYIISVFATTDYVDDTTFLPKLPAPLANADLTREFFTDYQTFFRIFVFKAEDAVLLDRYAERIAFHELHFSSPKPANAIDFGQLNERPIWLLEDESPRSFDGKENLIKFLFQTKLDYEFKTIQGAARQKVIDYSISEHRIRDSDVAGYTLFTSNELYFFGVNRDERFIYVVPQS